MKRMDIASMLECFSVFVKGGSFKLFKSEGRALPRMASDGQATVEFMLLLGSIAAVSLIFIKYFGKTMLGGFFTIIGMILGGGAPK